MEGPLDFQWPTSHGWPREGVFQVFMLVLSRKVGERILIGDQVTVTVVRITGGGVRLGIEAPAAMAVIREELQCEMDKSVEADSPPRAVPPSTPK